MLKTREVLRLRHELGLSLREIGQMVVWLIILKTVSMGLVQDYLKRVHRVLHQVLK